MVFLLIGFAASASSDKNDETDNFIFSDASVRYLVVPLQIFTVASNLTTDDQITDQFYIQSFNQLLSMEMQKYKLLFVEDSLKEFNQLVMHSPNPQQYPTDSIIALMEKFNCHRIFFAETCSLQQIDIQNEGWRHNRSGPSYQRPVRTIVTARIRYKVLDSEGKIEITRAIEGKSKKPFMYSFFKRFSKSSDIRKYAHSLYGPPGLKAISSGINKLFLDQSSD